MWRQGGIKTFLNKLPIEVLKVHVRREPNNQLNTANFSVSFNTIQSFGNNRTISHVDSSTYVIIDSTTFYTQIYQ